MADKSNRTALIESGILYKRTICYFDCRSVRITSSSIMHIKIESTSIGSVPQFAIRVYLISNKLTIINYKLLRISIFQ